MDREIIPESLSGTLTAPISKSSVHRLLICAAMADGPTEILYRGAVSDDIIATAGCLEGLGATVSMSESGTTVTPIDRSAPPKDVLLDCMESGSTLRFLIPVAAALGGTRRFKLRGRLPERPLSPLKEELERHGAEICLQGDILTVCGDGMTGGEFVIDGGVSSQFVSGLLFALPIMGGGTVRVTGKIESRPYIDMSVSALYNYGVSITESDGVFAVGESRLVSPVRVVAEGDFSGAAFFICAGALSERGILIKGLDTDSLQGDKRCVDIVKEMGADVTVCDGGVFVKRGELHGITVDASDIPDLVPAVAALAAAARGDTVITGTARLRLKESDRIATTCRMIEAIGGSAWGDDESITVNGGLSTPRSPVDPSGDHRIAMAAAILGSAAKGKILIKGAECVRKSYPSFWDDFDSLRGR